MIINVRFTSFFFLFFLTFFWFGFKTIRTIAVKSSEILLGTSTHFCFFLHIFFSQTPKNTANYLLAIKRMQEYFYAIKYSLP